MSYSNPQTCTYRFAAVGTLQTAAIVARIIGPSGLSGRLVDIGSVVTTAVETAATTIDVGTTADPDAHGTLSIPISSANAVANGATIVAGHIMAADTVVEVSTNGEGSAGAADLLITIDWY